MADEKKVEEGAGNDEAEPNEEVSSKESAPQQLKEKGLEQQEDDKKPVVKKTVQKKPHASVSVRVVERKTNPLLGREELMVEVSHERQATPSRQELRSLIAREAKIAEDLLIVDRIFTRVGRNLTDAVVLGYRQKEQIPQGKQEKMNRRLGVKSEEQGTEGKEKKEQAAA